MAKLKSIPYTKASKSGETMSFTAEVAVGNDGRFTITIPDQLSGTAIAHAGSDEWKTKVRVSKARVNWRVESAILEDGDRFISSAIDNYLQCTEHVELVILYKHENRTCGAADDTGGLHPNGYFASAASKDGKHYNWVSNQNLYASNAPKAFTIGLTAFVREKVTYERASGTRVIYRRPASDHNDDSPMQRLMSFLLAWTDDPMRHGFSEMPYSDKAANFFSDALLTMMRLGMQIDALVGDRDQLMLGIERKAALTGIEGPK